eukprot:6177751-Pleurochrysis_carterae.AAC.9
MHIHFFTRPTAQKIATKCHLVLQDCSTNSTGYAVNTALARQNYILVHISQARARRDYSITVCRL